MERRRFAQGQAEGDLICELRRSGIAERLGRPRRQRRLEETQSQLQASVQHALRAEKASLAEREMPVQRDFALEKAGNVGNPD